MAQFLLNGGHLIQVKITKKDKHKTATEWLQPSDRGGGLIIIIIATNTTFA